MFKEKNTAAHGRNIIVTSAIVALCAFAASPAEAQQASVVVAQGIGWQRVVEPAASNVAAYGAAATDRDIIVVNSAAGLENAPLPATVKDMLRDDFIDPNVAISTAGVQEAVMIDLAVAEAIADGTAESEYAAFIEPDEPGEGEVSVEWGCDTGWRDREWQVYDQSFGSNRGMQSNTSQRALQASVNFSGHASVFLGYKYKKTRFCLPYVAWFRHVRVAGEANFDGSNLTASSSYASTTLQHQWRQEFGRLFDFSRTFFVGPLPVHAGVMLPFGLGFDVALDLGLGVQLDIPLRGSVFFNYTCDFGGCDETPGTSGTDADVDVINGNSVQVGDVGASASGSANIQIRPYFWAELVGYLYHREVASAGFGIEAGLPVRAGAYIGNFGDANADGSSERVDGYFADVNAEASLYFTYDLAGFSDAIGLDWSLSVDLFPGWRIYTLEDDDDVFRGRAGLVTIRKNLWFTYGTLGTNEHSMFSPVVSGDRTPIIGVSTSFAISPRYCHPFKDAMTYLVTWPDGSTDELTQPSKDLPARFNASWDTIDPATLRIRPLEDEAGRTYDVEVGANTTVYEVQPVSMVPPPSPSSVSVPAQVSPCSTCTARVTWTASPITQSYDVQRRENSGAWTDYTSTPASVRNLEVPTNRLGLFMYRVRSCNNYGCSPWRQSSTMQVGTKPGTPTLSVQSQLCYGLNDVTWTSVASADRYKLWRTPSSAWSSALKVYDGTSRSFFSNVGSDVWYRVQACNAVGCGALSSAKKAARLNTCY